MHMNLATEAGSRLDLRQRGKAFDRFLNWLRHTILLNWIVGWETLDPAKPNRCCSGHLGRLGISDDGDIVLHLEAPRDSAADASAGSPKWECQPLLNERNAAVGLVCELPLRDRPNFSNLSELEVCLLVRVCGRWVRDRLHGHNELHPISSIEILRGRTQR